MNAYGYRKLFLNAHLNVDEIYPINVDSIFKISGLNTYVWELENLELNFVNDGGDGENPIIQLTSIAKF